LPGGAAEGAGRVRAPVRGSTAPAPRRQGVAGRSLRGHRSRAPVPADQASPRPGLTFPIPDCAPRSISGTAVAAAATDGEVILATHPHPGAAGGRPAPARAPGRAPPPTGSPPAMTTTDTTSRIFQTSRRRSHGLVVGILLVLGYFGTAAVLISD